MRKDLNTTIVNLSNSILKRFGVDTYHESIKEIDEILANHSKIAVILYDGLGSSIIDNHLPKEANLRSNVFMEIDAATPPTTVASTTAFLSAKYPIETGWLGWSQYFENEDVTVDVFSNQISGSKKFFNGPSLINKYCPYENIISLINKGHNKNVADLIFPYPINKSGPRTLLSFNKNISNKLKNKNFVYAYWTNPDSLMHKYGAYSIKANKCIKKIDKSVLKLANKNKDTLFIVIADHGHINHISLDFSNEPRISNMLTRQISIEQRFATFFVKPEFRTTFKDTFFDVFKDFKDCFEIYSREEAIKSHLFGEGTPNRMSLDFIGDFVVVSKDVYSLTQSSNKKIDLLVSHHAGLTPDELRIKVNILNK